MNNDETIAEEYRGCVIVAHRYVSDDKVWFNFELRHNGKFLFQDTNTIDGGASITNIRQAINEARKNIDSLIRTNSLYEQENH